MVPQRLSPLSPIVRIGRAFLGLLVLLIAHQASTGTGKSNGTGDIVDVVVVGAVLVLAVVSWWVTTWRIDGDTLQVATGLIRRNTVRLPLARVQAVDLVEPLLARMLGLAEVRVRTAGGSGGDARLQYLKLEDANWVRSSLLAMAHGLPDTTPAPSERPLFQISNSRLIGSICLTGPALAALIPFAVVLVLVATGTVSAAAIGAAGGTLLLDIFAVVSRMVRRVTEEWDFAVAEAPDGLRIRSGFASRVAETIPYGRVQAVSMQEPLLWRPFGWCRLELHLAGAVRRGHDQPRSAIRRALLPVGTRAEVEWLLGRVLAEHEVPLTRPPRAAVVRAPLRYHFLAAGRNRSCAVSVSGRVRRLTEWVPLGKVQSIRYAQGPFQRALRLASVHLDVAGRRTSVRWLDRSGAEADELMRSLPLECEAARDRDAAASHVVPAAAEPSPAVAPAPPPASPPALNGGTPASA
ncbi:MAG: PH domain-containing protein [Acidimicrobiales bacterium]